MSWPDVAMVVLCTGYGLICWRMVRRSHWHALVSVLRAYLRAYLQVRAQRASETLQVTVRRELVSGPLAGKRLPYGVTKREQLPALCGMSKQNPIASEPCYLCGGPVDLNDPAALSGIKHGHARLLCGCHTRPSQGAISREQLSMTGNLPAQIATVRAPKPSA